MEQVELRSSLLLAEALVLLAQKPVQAQDGSIGDHHIPKSIELVANRVRDSDLVEHELDKVAEVRGEQRRQPLVEPAG